MATPLERMRTTWAAEGRLGLHRVVEDMAREGVSQAELDGALDALLDEARTAGVSEETEEDILGVGDRLSGWCLASQRIVARKADLPTQEEIARLPRWARMAFAARSARRVLPLVNHLRSNLPEDVTRQMAMDVSRLETGAATKRNVAQFEGEQIYVAQGDPTACVGGAVGAADALDAAGAAYWAHEAAVRGLPGTGPQVRQAIRGDYDTLVHLAELGRWDDDTPVSPEVFGPMWPAGPPSGWPSNKPAAIHVWTVVLPGGKLEVASPDLPVGTTVQVTITVPEPTPSPGVVGSVSSAS